MYCQRSEALRLNNFVFENTNLVEQEIENLIRHITEALLIFDYPTTLKTYISSQAYMVLLVSCSNIKKKYFQSHAKSEGHYQTSLFKVHIIGVGVMGQWLRALLVLLEELGSVHSTHMAVFYLLTPVSENLAPSSGPCGYCLHVVQRHSGRLNTQPYKIIKINLKNYIIYTF